MPAGKKSGLLESRPLTALTVGGPRVLGQRVLTRPASRKTSLTRFDRLPSSSSTSHSAAESAVEVVAAGEGRSCGIAAAEQCTLRHSYSPSVSLNERQAVAPGDVGPPRTPSPVAIPPLSALLSQARLSPSVRRQPSLPVQRDSPRGSVAAVEETYEGQQVLHELYVLKHLLAQLQRRLLDVQRDLAIQELSGVL